MPQEVKTQPGSGAPGPAGDGSGEKTLQGWTVDLSDPALALDALEKAFDYRGDVTLTLRDGSEVSGYIFDRRRGADLSSSSVRLLPESSDERVTVPYDRIARVSFSGRDTAHGKSFETWMRKYAEKKLAELAAREQS